MTIRLRSLTISALSVFLATSAIAAPLSTTPNPKQTKLIGKRLADQLLTASDAKRKSIPGRALAMAIRRHGSRRAALRADFLMAHNDKYSLELEATPEIYDQAQSGRCWIFTTLNVLEREVFTRTQKHVKLSRNYVDARNLQASAYELLQSGASINGLRSVAENDISEGGYFGWATQIVDKYGVVPEHVMRDFVDSKGSDTAIKMLQTIVVAAQDKLAKVDKSSPEALEILKGAQAQIDTAVARAFTGKDKLPEKFIVDGKEYTPRTYADQVVGTKSSQFVTLQDEKSQRHGWYSQGESVHRYMAYNTGDIEIMKKSVINALKLGKKVYVSFPVGDAGAPYISSVDAYGSLPAGKGIISISAHDYETLGMGKAITDRATIQRTGLNETNHAMTISGVDLDENGKPVKWRFENSWAKKAGDRGIFHVYDDAFTAFVGDVSVPKDAVPAHVMKKMDEELKATLAAPAEPK